MTIRRNYFFCLLLLLVTGPFIIHKLIWIAGSEKTTGTMGFAGKEITGQIAHIYSVISFVAGNDTVWFNGNDNVLYKPGEPVPVRYQRLHPSDARINIFGSIWGDTIVYGGLPAIALLIMFLNPFIIPWKSQVRLSVRKPFVKVI